MERGINYDSYDLQDVDNYDLQGSATPEEVKQAVDKGDIKVIGQQVFDSLGNLLGQITSNRTLANIVSAWKTESDKGTYRDRLNYFSQVATDNLINFANELKGSADPNFMKYLGETINGVQTGKLNPIQALGAVQKQSELNNIAVPQYIKDTQRETLGRLGDVSRQGYTTVERAAIQKALDQVQSRTRGETEAIKDDLRARGQYGAGSELAMRQMAQQAGANQAAQQALDIESNAMKRALEALQMQGAQANQMNQQEFTQQSQVASAQDQINKFNAEMQQALNLANANLADKYQSKLTDTAKAEYEAAQKKQQMQGTALGQAAGNAAGMYRAPFEVESKIIDAQNKQLNTVLSPKEGQTAVGNVANTAKDVNNIINTGKNLWETGKAVWNFFSDERVKENKTEMSDEEIFEALNQLVPYSFNYKKGAKAAGAPQGKVIGVMAQHIEKGPARGMVDNSSGVKVVEGDKAIQFALAALSSLNNRINDLEKK